MRRGDHRSYAAALVGAGAAALLLAGCVFQSTYNNMLQQQEAIESALRSEIAADQVKIDQLENGIRVRMSNDLLFREGGVELSEAGARALDKVVPQLNTSAYIVDVVGSTDNVPIGPGLADRYPTNWELAGARAAVVVRHLQAGGVDPTAMRAVSDGQYHPVASNDTAQGRADNRNVSLLLRPR
ncbi:OmpA family protein [bacterium]|nr:OmpA family protein [bacterium]